MFSSWLCFPLDIMCDLYAVEYSGSLTHHASWEKDRKRSLQGGLVEILHIPQTN